MNTNLDVALQYALHMQTTCMKVEAALITNFRTLFDLLVDFLTMVLCSRRNSSEKDACSVFFQIIFWDHYQPTCFILLNLTHGVSKMILALEKASSCRGPNFGGGKGDDVTKGLYMRHEEIFLICECNSHAVYKLTQDKLTAN